MKQVFVKKSIVGKSLFFLLSFFILSLSVANAQSTDYAPDDIIGFQVEVMKERLDLNDTQVEKLLTLNREDAERTRNMSTEQAKQVRNERELKYQLILTVDQYQKWVAQKDEINLEAQERYFNSELYADDHTVRYGRKVKRN